MTETSQNMSAGGVCDGIIMFIMSSTFSLKGRKFPNIKGCARSPVHFTFTETFKSCVTHNGFLTTQLQRSFSSTVDLIAALLSFYCVLYQRALAGRLLWIFLARLK